MDWKEAILAVAGREALLSAAGKIIAGLLGSLVSLRFVQGSVLQKLHMLISGAIFSWYGTGIAVRYWGEEVEPVAAFFIGLFGMSIASKLHETLQALSASEVATAVTSFIKRQIDKV